MGPRRRPRRPSVRQKPAERPLHPTPLRSALGARRAHPVPPVHRRRTLRDGWFRRGKGLSLDQRLARLAEPRDAIPVPRHPGRRSRGRGHRPDSPACSSRACRDLGDGVEAGDRTSCLAIREQIASRHDHRRCDRSWEHAHAPGGIRVRACDASDRLGGHRQSVPPWMGAGRPVDPSDSSQLRGSISACTRRRTSWVASLSGSRSVAQPTSSSVYRSASALTRGLPETRAYFAAFSLSARRQLARGAGLPTRSLPRTRWRRRGEKAAIVAAVLLFRALTYGIQIPIGGITHRIGYPSAVLVGKRRGHRAIDPKIRPDAIDADRARSS
jgi:hypothetical protein